MNYQLDSEILANCSTVWKRKSAMFGLGKLLTRTEDTVKQSKQTCQIFLSNPHVHRLGGRDWGLRGRCVHYLVTLAAVEEIKNLFSGRSQEVDTIFPEMLKDVVWQSFGTLQCCVEDHGNTCGVAYRCCDFSDLSENCNVHCVWENVFIERNI